MKLMKRLTALILSVVMVLSMGVSALATGETTSTVENTISNIHWRDNNGEKISGDYTVKREQTRYQLWATINGVEQIWEDFDISSVSTTATEGIALKKGTSNGKQVVVVTLSQAGTYTISCTYGDEKADMTLVYNPENSGNTEGGGNTGGNTGDSSDNGTETTQTTSINLGGVSYENGATIEIGEKDFPLDLRVQLGNSNLALKRYICIKEEGKENTYTLDEKYLLSVNGNLELGFDESKLAEKIAAGENLKLSKAEMHLGTAQVGDIATFTYTNSQDNINVSFTIKVVATPYYELRGTNGEKITALGLEPVTAQLYYVNGDEATLVEGLSNDNIMFRTAAEGGADIMIEPSDDGKSVQLTACKNGSANIFYYDSENNRHTVSELTVSGIDFSLCDLNGNEITTIGAEPVIAVLYNGETPVELNGENGLGSTDWGIENPGSVNIEYVSYVVNDTTYKAAKLTGTKNGTVQLTYNRGLYRLNTLKVEGVVSYDLYISADGETYEPWEEMTKYDGTIYIKLRQDGNDVNIKGTMTTTGDSYCTLEYPDDYTIKTDLRG